MIYNIECKKFLLICLFLKLYDLGEKMEIKIEYINPYIRRATKYRLKSPFYSNDAVLFDYALIYVVDGVCDIIAENICHRCEKGCIILIPPGVKRRLSSVENADFVQAYITFDLKYDEFSGQRYINQVRTIEELSEDERKMIGKNVFSESDVQLFKEENHKETVEKLYKIIDLFEKDTPYEMLKCKGLLCEILGDLFLNRVECTFKSPSMVIREAQNILIIEQIRDYIEQNFTRQITLEDISATFFINKYTLIRQFKKQYGISVMQYIKNLKLRTAKGMLVQRKKSVAEISTALGFDSIYAFSRFFKNNVGISPKKYQEKNIKR